MTQRLSVYEPIAPCLTAPNANPQGLGQLQGKVIGFIDNSKPNFELLVDDLSILLTERYGVKAILRQRKRSASQGASVALIEEMVSKADAVITGSGD